MMSKTKKILVFGLSLMMPAGLSRRVCTEQESTPDTGFSRALMGGIHDPCMVENTDCLLACHHTRRDTGDMLPAFCGEYKVGEEPSYFIGCNEKFQKCIDKPLSFWQQWKGSNRFWRVKNPTLRILGTYAGGTAILVLGGMLAREAGVIIALPLALAYAVLFTVE